MGEGETAGMRQSSITPVILCGGAGKRLWPLSREASPKQFLALAESRTLLQSTALRTSGRAGFGELIVIAHADHRFLVAEQLRPLGIGPYRIVLEPTGRNTAPAATVGALLAAAADPDGLMLLMPADHVIGDVAAFHDAIEAGARLARQGQFVLFGITPDHAATGYGYIEAGEPLEGGRVRRVTRFVEKPDRPTAENYLEAGNFVWNSGIFLLPAAGFLREVARLAPDILAAAEHAVAAAAADPDYTRLDQEAFAASPSISVDYAIFEKTDRAAVVPVDMNWTDIGSWLALWDFMPKDAAGNVISGPVMVEKTSNAYIRSEGPFVATIGMDDVIVVATEDTVLVVEQGARPGREADRGTNRSREEGGSCG